MPSCDNMYSRLAAVTDACDLTRREEGTGPGRHDKGKKTARAGRARPAESTVQAARRKTHPQRLENLPCEGKRRIPGGVDELDLGRDRERRAHLGRLMTGKRRRRVAGGGRTKSRCKGNNRRALEKMASLGRPRKEIPVGQVPTTTREGSRGFSGGDEERLTPGRRRLGELIRQRQGMNRWSGEGEEGGERVRIRWRGRVGRRRQRPAATQPAPEVETGGKVEDAWRSVKQGRK